MLPGCALVQSTQASTMALAVSALMTAFINVFLATSDDPVTLLNGAGDEPCCQAAALLKSKAAAATAEHTATLKTRVCFVMLCLPSLAYGIFIPAPCGRRPRTEKRQL